MACVTEGGFDGVQSLHGAAGAKQKDGGLSPVAAAETVEVGTFCRKQVCPNFR